MSGIKTPFGMPLLLLSFVELAAVADAVALDEDTRDEVAVSRSDSLVVPVAREALDVDRVTADDVVVVTIALEVAAVSFHNGAGSVVVVK